MLNKKMNEEKNPNIFQVLSGVFAKGGIVSILIGGFAVNYYKVTRQTADIDFLITKDDFEKILKLLEEKGFKKDYEQEVFARFLGEKPYLMDVDFMFVDKETLDKIVKEGRQISIAQEKFIIPCLNHLIALKLHAIKYNPKIREYRDLPDIIELIRINKINAKDAEFKNLCLKYGTEEIYNKILEEI
jgi:hypothetical protein